MLPGEALRGRVIVEPEDCLDVAFNMSKSTGTRVLVLNMAHPRQPGGDYLKGSGAQEEDLVRRSSLGLAIDPKMRELFFSDQTFPNLPAPPTYPICGHDLNQPIEQEFGGVLTRNVTVFRSGEASAMHLLNLSKSTSCLLPPIAWSAISQSACQHWWLKHIASCSALWPSLPNVATKTSCSAQ